MKLLDLFSGGKSVTRVAESLGYTVTTLDINKNYKPDIIANVLDFDYQSHFKPGDFDALDFSPTHETFESKILYTGLLNQNLALSLVV